VIYPKFLTLLLFIALCSIASAQPHALQIFNTSNSPLPEDNIRALSIAPDSTLWIGTENGLATLKNGNWGKIDTLQGYQIRAIAFDTAGHAWVGTFLSGFWVQTDTSWIHYTTANSNLPDDFVRTISFCPSGDAWLGTVGGALQITNGNWNVYRAANTNWFVEHIASSYCTPNNVIWLGGLNSGLMRQQDTTWVIYRHFTSGLPDNTVLDIKRNVNGDYLLAMPASGAAAFDGNLGWVYYNTITSYNPSNSINHIAIGNNSNLYFASADKGLVVYEGGLDWYNISTINKPDIGGYYLPSDQLLNLAYDPSGVIWASAANEGLLRIEFMDTISGITNQNTSKTEISIYPNPAQDYIIVESLASELSISITDILGQAVFTQHSYALKTKVPLSNLPKGTYIVTVQSSHSVFTQSLIKY
jgi:ligand-binding sensor domain-containing protein